MDPETMQPVPADGETIGEVMFRGNIVMKGYLKNPKATDGGLRRRLVPFRRSRRACTPTATSSSRTARRTSSSRAARTSRRSRSRTCSTSTPPSLAAAVVAKPDEKWGETPCAFVELKPGHDATAKRDHRLVPRAPRPLQGAAPRRVRRDAEDLDRQDPEIQAARDGENRLTTAITPAAEISASRRRP